MLKPRRSAVAFAAAFPAAHGAPAFEGHSVAAVTVVAICGLPESAAIAEQRQALCKLVVDGKTYINGRCDFEVLDPDGSFTITGKVHFVYVMVKGNTADATWNRDPKSFHAESPLGTLTRAGACWENATAQICARNLPNK